MAELQTVDYSYSFNASSGNTTSDAGASRPRYNWAVLLMFIVVFGAIGGNILVCLAVKQEPKLRNMFNYFLVSLAMSDLLCALLVMPVTIVKAFIGDLEEPKQMCQAWYALDVLFTSSTIMHLTVISIDRYMALKFPLKYGAARRTRHTVFKIMLVWILAFSLAGPLFYGTMIVNDSKEKKEGEIAFKGCGPENASFIVPAVVISFFLPLLIMTTMYVLTIITLRQQTRQQVHLQLKKFTVYQKDDSCYSVNSDNPAVNPQRTHRNLTALNQQCPPKSLSFNSPSKSPHIPLLVKSSSTDTAIATVDSAFEDDSIPFKQKVLLALPTQNNPKTAPNGIGQSPKSAKLDRMASDAASTVSGSDENNTMDEESTPSTSPVHKPVRQISIAQKIKSKLTRHNAKHNLHWRRANSQVKARKAVKVLGVLFLVFVICYLPFFLTYTIRGICAGGCAHGISDALIQAFEWLGYSGSMINPIVYHVFSKEFRVVFYRILRCKTCAKNR